MSRDEKRRDLARQQLLEEIRNRAEEAELARIEAEELKLALEAPALSLMSANPLAPASEFPQSTEVTDLRDELAQALISNDLARATALHAELMALLPEDPAVEQFEVEIAKLRESVEQNKARRAKTLEDKAKIDDLFNAANEAYQHERYDEALENIHTLLALDPENSSALDFRDEIEKAKRLSERVAAEEREKKLADQRQAHQVQLALRQKSPSHVRQPQEATEPAPVPVPPPEGKHNSRGPDDFTAWRTAADFLLQHKWSIVLAGVLAFLAIQTAALVYDHLRSTLLRKRASVVVVPLHHAEAGSDYLTLGLTDEVIARLSQVGDLTVFATPTSLRREAGDLDGTRLARTLGAEFVLTLDVRSTAESTVVHVRLKELADGRVVLERPWSVTHSTLAHVSAEALPMVVRALGIAADDELPVRHVHTPVGGAYEAYLSARAWLRSTEPGALDSATKALQLATQHDSLFAEAFILCGWARILSYEASQDTGSILVQQAHANLQRGIGLGSKGSDVYTLWGMIAYYSAHYHEAVARLTEAVERAPSDAEALRRLALAQLRIGRSEQALSAARSSAEYDPGNPASHSLLGMLSLLLGDTRTAMREFQTAIATTHAGLQRYPDTYIAALVANDLREQALDLVKQQAHRQPDNAVALYDLGRMYQLAGKPRRLWEETFGRAKALVLHRLNETPRNARLYSYLALIETRLGNFEQGMNANSSALALAPHDYETLYNATRVLTLQRGQSPEAYAFLARAINRRFSLRHILDLDLTILRRDPEFVLKITQ